MRNTSWARALMQQTWKRSCDWMLNRNQQEYVSKLLQKYQGPTHETDYFKDLGLDRFIVLEGVLSPEKSAQSPLFARFLYEHKNLYKNADVLELGSGSGILGIIMAKYGAKRVVATDIQDVCVRNIKENSLRYNLDCIETRQGDLFECIDEKERFDLIVFNYPFFYGKPIKGNTISIAILDEGNIIKRFLSEGPRYFKPNGKIITAFSEVAGKGNDPTIHAKKYGLYIGVLETFETKTGKKFIYEVTKAQT